jgi:predicted amidohydrolase YtcJ
VFHGGRVWSAHLGDERPTALAVRGGRIAAVGSDREVRGLAGPRVAAVDLRGRLLLPGFIDAHVHPVWGGLGSMRCDLHDVDPSAYEATIRAYAERAPDRAWIEGAGWYMAAFPGGTPRLEQLDRVVSDRPAFLENRDGHGAWVNSRALELAGLDRDTPDPPDGRIERDDDGRPSGTLHEGAMDLVRRLVPRPTPAELEEAVLRAQAELHGLGITGWQDAIVDDETLPAYLAVAGRGELTARVVGALWWDRHRGEEQIEDLLALRERGRAGRFAATSVKVMQDGVAENFTAAMTAPYLDVHGLDTGNAGLSMVEPELLKRAVARLDAEGFQVHVHAIGDRAVREALDAFEAARAANGPTDGRHHIAHLQVVHPDDLPRFAALGVTANAQPFWACFDSQMVDLTLPFLGPERSAWQYPFGSLLRAGARLAFGSDWTVSTANPLLELEVAVNRVDPDHRSDDAFYPAERLTLEQGLRAFTEGSAYVNHLDHVTGTLEVGRLADLAVLDRDVLAPDAGPVGEARVALTLVEGEIVFEAGERGA